MFRKVKLRKVGRIGRIGRGWRSRTGAPVEDVCQSRQRESDDYVADAGEYEYCRPMRTILIRFPTDQADELSLISRQQNYGEDVYRYARDNGKGMGEVDLGEVDAALTEFSIRGVARSKVRRLRKWVEEEAARQNLLVKTEVL